MTVTKDSGAVQVVGTGALTVADPELIAARWKVRRILDGNLSLAAGNAIAELLANCRPPDDRALRIALDEAMLAYPRDHPLMLAAPGWYRLLRTRQRIEAGYDSPDAAAWADRDCTVWWGDGPHLIRPLRRLRRQLRRWTW